MNFYFIVDTSLSMMQGCNQYSLLDLAKAIVERLSDLRVKHSESKFDKYFLSSTFPNETDPIAYSLPADTYIFQTYLKTLMISP